jgi:hypothetical protein
MNDVLEDEGEREREGDGGRPQVLLAYGRERAAMEPFFEIASRYFEWKKVFSFPSDEELEQEKKREEEGEDFSPSQLGWIIDVISMTKIKMK